MPTFSLTLSPVIAGDSTVSIANGWFGPPQSCNDGCMLTRAKPTDLPRWNLASSRPPKSSLLQPSFAPMLWAEQKSQIDATCQFRKPVVRTMI